MPWSGSGTFTRTDGTRTGDEVWQDAAAAPVKIRADHHDTHDQDMADGIEACIAKNGENSPTLLVMAGVLKMEGNELRLDADEDSSIQCASDDIMDFDVGGIRTFRVEVGGVEVRWNDAGAAVGPSLTLLRDSASPAAADLIGDVVFAGKDSAAVETVYARIGGEIVDPTDASEDGQINFYVAIGGSLAEVMTLDHATGLTVTRPALFNVAVGDPVTVTGTGGSFGDEVLALDCHRTANSGFDFLTATSDSDGTPDVEFRLIGDGEAVADGSFTGSGAGYAEMFEWADGNPAAEDRVGCTVALDGMKIRQAHPGDQVVGVITGRPTVVGNARAHKWVGRYELDEFNRYRKTADGARVQSRAFDPKREYVPRRERPEWGCVSLLGQEIVRAGQPVGDRWLELEQRGRGVSLWLVR